MSVVGAQMRAIFAQNVGPKALKDRVVFMPGLQNAMDIYSYGQRCLYMIVGRAATFVLGCSAGHDADSGHRSQGTGR